jgi:hypothetical protein
MDEKKGNEKTISTKHIHNQELCVNPNFTCSQPRAMCQSKHHLFISKGMSPLGIKKIWDLVFFIPFQLIFYLNLVFQIFSV